MKFRRFADRIDALLFGNSFQRITESDDAHIAMITTHADHGNHALARAEIIAYKSARPRMVLRASGRALLHGLKVWLFFHFLMMVSFSAWREGPGALARVLRDTTPLMVGENLAAAAGAIAVGSLVRRFVPISRWSLFAIFRGKGGRISDEAATNVNLMPMRVRYLGLVFGVALLIQIPYFAEIEEFMFRDGRHGWGPSILWSILFGFAHCMVGVPLWAGAGLSVLGFFLAWKYNVGGLDASIQSHASYNVMLVSMALAFYAVRTAVGMWRDLKGWRAGSPSPERA